MNFKLFVSEPDGVTSSYSFTEWWSANSAYNTLTESGASCLLLMSSPETIEGISQKLLNLSKNGAAH